MDNTETEKKSIKNFESYKENPSKITGFEKHENTIKAREFEMVNPETGEVYYGRPVDKKAIYYRDEKAYIKIFKDSLFKIGRLNTPALKLFTYISYNIEKNKDEIIIDVMSFLEKFDYSTEGKAVNRSHYYKGIVELLLNEIVYKKIGSDTTFFINIDVFFNGKRDGLFNDYNNRPPVKPKK